MRANKFRGSRALSKHVYGRITFSSACLLIFLISYTAPALSAEKGREEAALSKAHIQKLRRAAEIITLALSEKGIKTVKVFEFTDIKGGPSALGREMSGAFKIQLGSAGKKNFRLIEQDPEALVKGVLAPFKQKGKWQLKIIAVTRDKGAVIMSYTGVFKMEKTAEGI